MSKNNKRAKEVTGNKYKTEILSGRVWSLLEKVPVVSTLRALKRVPELCRMVSAYAKKEYTRVPKKTVIMAAGGLIYFVSPVDAYHDYLPGGYIDDAIVLEQILNAISDDVDDFSKWKRREEKLPNTL